MSAPDRKPALHEDFPPTVGIDPGARWTGIALRIGGGQGACVAARSHYNPLQPRPGGRKELIPVEPSTIREFISTVTELMIAYDAQARQWWTDGGFQLGEAAAAANAVLREQLPEHLVADVVGGWVAGPWPEQWTAEQHDAAASLVARWAVNADPELAVRQLSDDPAGVLAHTVGRVAQTAADLSLGLLQRAQEGAQ